MSVLTPPVPRRHQPITDSGPMNWFSKNLAWLWLLLGFALLPFAAWRTVIPLAAWIAPVFLLRFVRISRRTRIALLLIFVVYAASALFDLRGATGTGAELALTLVTFPLGRGILYMLPYAADRVLGSRLSAWPRLFVFPLAFTSLDWVMSLLHATGTFGSPAYSQYGVLPLEQIVAVTGMWGLTFLIMWFASTVNAIWEHGLRWHLTRGPMSLFAVAFAGVLVFGIVRLDVSTPTSPAVRVATITINDTVLNNAVSGIDYETFNQSTDQQRAAIRPKLEATLDQMLTRTEAAMRQGAKLVVWQEELGECVSRRPAERH